MTQDEWANLKRGDVIVNRDTGMAYVVSENRGPYGVSLTLLSMALDPDEWRAASSPEREHALVTRERVSV